MSAVIKDLTASPKQITDCTWEHHPAIAGKPAFDEADVSAWFADHVSAEYAESLHVTIRKYPSRYFVAFSFYLFDDTSREGFIEYTQDGNGDGRIELNPVYLVMKVVHSEFERGFDTYMQQLDEIIEKVIEREYCR